MTGAAATDLHWRRGWLIKAAVGASLVGLLAAGFAVAIGGHGFGDFAAGRRAIFAGMFAAFALLLGGAAVTYAGELLRPRRVVRIDAEGVCDRRLSPATVAWGSIAAVFPIQHGMQLLLALDVADPRAVPLPRQPLWRVNRLAARLLGNPEMSVRITGLDADLFAVLRAIEACRPPPAPAAAPPHPSAAA